MFKRILVATDGSKLSQTAVRSAIELAALNGADLVAVKVVPRYPQSYFEGGVAMEPAYIQQIERQWAEDGQTVVDAVQKAALAKGVKTKAVTVKSDLVSDAIIAAAKKHRCDLIVMASHGRRGIKRLLLGSGNPACADAHHDPGTGAEIGPAGDCAKAAYQAFSLM